MSVGYKVNLLQIQFMPNSLTIVHASLQMLVHLIMSHVTCMSAVHFYPLLYMLSVIGPLGITGEGAPGLVKGAPALD